MAKQNRYGSERQPGESAKAHEAYLAYRDLGERRSLEALNQSGTKSGPKSLSVLKRWSVEHCWVERCRRFENELQQARDQEIARDAALWQRRQLEQREEEFLAGTRLLDRAKVMLAFPLEKRTVEKVGDKTYVTIEPARWSFRDAAAMLRMGIDLANQAIHGHGPSVAPAKDDEYDPGDVSGGLSPEQIDAARAAIVRLALGDSADDDD